MTRFVRFAIEGLAGRTEPTEYTFQPDVNIFFGLNGSGKTSLLRILFSALQDDVALLRRVPFRTASVTFIPNDAPDPVTRSISAELVEQLPQAQPTIVMTASGPITFPMTGPQHGWSSTARPNEVFLASYLSTARLFGDPSMSFWVNGPDASPYSEPRLDQQFLQLVTNRWANYMNQQLTRVRSLQDEGIADILASLFMARTKGKPASDASEAYEHVTHFLERRNLDFSVPEERFLQQYSNDRNLQRVIADIQRTERRINEVERPREELSALVKQFVTNKQVTFSDAGIEVRATDRSIGLDQLSSGEKHLLRILVECLSAQSNCLLIDEPELSLHIDWQHELVSAMRRVNPELQVIIATHSPEIMAEVADNKIHAL